MSIEATAQPLPSDWPGPGPIDLAAHDRPHGSATLEWWYLNCHLRSDDGRDLSLFASFFRTAVGRDERTGDHVHAHALTWALVDASTERYLAESLVDPDAPAIARGRLERGEGLRDPLMRRAMLEMLARGRVPEPDRLMERPADVSTGRLRLDYEGRRLEKIGDGRYALRLSRADGAAVVALTFTLRRPAIRHGLDGIVHGKSAEDMFYYFSPRCEVVGEVELDGRATAVHGDGWYDHEFGRPIRRDDDEGGRLLGVSWDWISAMLDDGSDLSIYCLVDETGQSLGRFAVLIDPQGLVSRYGESEFAFEPGTGRADAWTSSRTFQRYPTAWSIAIPAAALSLDIEAALPGQELITTISRPAFWEGRVGLRGRRGDRAVAGLGFVERSGLESIDTVDQFFAAVGRATRDSVRALLPRELTPESAARLVAGENRRDYLEDVDLTQLAATIVDPIRTITDRGGKAWRSYVALACCDAVGGNSQPYLSWLALPELVHVGSLMVDDVEDHSTVRRGGPSAHLLFGEPLAINAGCACYFLPQLYLERLELPPTETLRVYQLYFEAIRAGHAGQALDLSGFDREMPRVVEEGDGAWIERRVRAVHRLKSAAPASCLARIGAIIGRGSDTQIDALGRFVESVGIAFQIVDDVLNLSGFERDLKSTGEDLAEGKVTMPIAKAMSLASLAERRRLWEIASARSSDPELTREGIAIVRDCGALEACRLDAELMVEHAWQQLEGLLPESGPKLMLRVFSWRVLERTY